MIPKFFVGEKVRVKHPYQGTWIGYVLKSALADDEYEYVVSNAPQPYGFPILAWESEIESIIDVL